MRDRDAEEAVQKLAGTYLKDTRLSTPATVMAYVDDPSADDYLTCTVQTIGDDAQITIPGVLLLPVVDDGLVVFPSVGSTVFIALSTRNNIFIEAYSKIDKLQLTIPNGAGGWTTLEISSAGIQMNDGTFGGLVKLVDPSDPTAGVLARLNALEQFVKTLQTAIGLWSPAPGDGGAALKTALTAWLASTAPTTTRAELENTLITQGK